jgi:hypothetical protein
MLGRAATEMFGDGKLSLALLSKNEQADEWAYFAKKEYGDGSVSPVVVYAYGDERVRAGALELNPTSVTYGQTSTATVYLNNPAPEGGKALLVRVDRRYAFAPPSIIIPAGQMAGSFTVSTHVLRLPEEPDPNTDAWVVVGDNDYNWETETLTIRQP